MIPFTMKILGFKGGTYTVEYIPQNPSCKPIKLDILLDQGTLFYKDQIIERLKSAAPQEYWQNQIIAETAKEITDVAASLVNTSHQVSDASSRVVNPVNNFNFHPPAQPLQGPDIDAVPLPRQANIPAAGSSTPEEVAGREEQNIIKLKILIQQVIQEMAEGTV